MFRLTNEIRHSVNLRDENSSGTTLIKDVFFHPVRIKDSRGDEKVNGYVIAIL